MLEVGEDIVLDDDEVMRLGDLEETVRGRRGERSTGRIVHA